MRIVVTSGFCLVLLAGCAKPVDTAARTVPLTTSTITLASQVVETSCGECQFGMGGTGCDLAVRIDGKPYFVDGTQIDDHGDAHGDDGLCNCIRQARVSGKIKDGRFVATTFALLPTAADQ